jgi:hypothetical protein
MRRFYDLDVEFARAHWQQSRILAHLLRRVAPVEARQFTIIGKVVAGRPAGGHGGHRARSAR